MRADSPWPSCSWSPKGRGAGQHQFGIGAVALGRARPPRPPPDQCARNRSRAGRRRWSVRGPRLRSGWPGSSKAGRCRPPGPAHTGRGRWAGRRVDGPRGPRCAPDGRSGPLVTGVPTGHDRTVAMVAKASDAVVCPTSGAATGRPWPMHTGRGGTSARTRWPRSSTGSRATVLLRAGAPPVPPALLRARETATSHGSLSLLSCRSRTALEDEQRRPGRVGCLGGPRCPGGRRHRVATARWLVAERDVGKRCMIEDAPLGQPRLGNYGQGDEGEVHEGVGGRAEPGSVRGEPVSPSTNSVYRRSEISRATGSGSRTSARRARRPRARGPR